jgi:hypothetical protein
MTGKIFSITSIVLGLIAAIVIASCAGLDIEKRRYRNGIYFNKQKRVHAPSASRTNVIEPVAVDGAKGSAVDHTLAKEYIREGEIITQEQVTHKTASFPKEIKKTKKAQFFYHDYILSTRTKDSADHNTGKEHTSALWLLSAVAPGLVLLRTNRSRNLSQWASQNVNKARWRITGHHVMLFLSSIGTGVMLHKLGIDFSPRSFNILAAAALGVFMFDALTRHKRNYQNRRIIPLRAMACALGAVIAAFYVVAGTKLHMLAGDHSWDIFNGFRALHADAVPDGERSTWETAGLIFLTLLLTGAALFSLAGIAVLSCKLACSGYGAVAIGIFAGGMFIVCFLYALAVQHMFKKPVKYPEERKEKRHAIFINSLKAAAIATGILISLMLIGGTF